MRGLIRGFSLIEVIIVAAIIGILAAVAIPAFLSRREVRIVREPDTGLCFAKHGSSIAGPVPCP